MHPQIKKYNIHKQLGFTLLETCITLIILSVLFGSGYAILTYSRKQQEKGFWIQQSVNQLRNATKRIEKDISSATYPSAQWKGKQYNYFDYKKYNGAILEKHVINNDNNLKIMAMQTPKEKLAVIAPINGEQEIMIIPKCTPAVEGNPGTIKWVRYVLLPSKHYPDLGDLYVEEANYTYDLKSDNYNKLFNAGVAFNKKDVKGRKLIVNDISDIEIASHTFNEAKNIEVGKDSDDKIETHRNKRKKCFMVVTIHTVNPKDPYTILEDKACNIINIIPYPTLNANYGTIYVKHIEDGNKAKIIVGEEEEGGIYKEGDLLKGEYEIVSISDQTVYLKPINGGRSKVLTLTPEKKE